MNRRQKVHRSGAVCTLGCWWQRGGGASERACKRERETRSREPREPRPEGGGKEKEAPHKRPLGPSPPARPRSRRLTPRRKRPRCRRGRLFPPPFPALGPLPLPPPIFRAPWRVSATLRAAETKERTRERRRSRELGPPGFLSLARPVPGQPTAPGRCGGDGA